ncbi:MAG: FKBP-type peptidyl-prolyl cis-trans isomerase [Lachnospiraceae bacterium]|nr:FKBP-type peptidyl-prolyl cis-trans isomerase [Lachnospiraceae bacterium]
MKEKDQKKANQETVSEPMSLSKQRKMERKQEIARQKRNAAIGKVVSIVVIAALCVGVVSFAGYKIYRSITRVKPSSDYSAMLEDNGMIKNVTASDYVTLCDYKNLTIPFSEVEYTDEELEEEIASLVEDKAALSETSDKVIEDGDKINIDYVGSIDGVEFEGGSTNGEGDDVTIGAGLMIDDFEEQMIGHKVGDEFIIQVTFPEEYSSNTELAGKDATFSITINGIYIAPEFDDAFVTEFLSDYASTAEEYKTYLKETNYKENLRNWIATYLLENSTVNSYPEEYMEHMKSLQKYEDEANYEYMAQIYTSYYGYNPYKNFEGYVGMSEAKYDKTLYETVQTQANQELIYQAAFEQEGLSVTEDDAVAYMVESGYTQDDYTESVETYGLGYVMQPMIAIAVIDAIAETATVQ